MAITHPIYNYKKCLTFSGKRKLFWDRCYNNWKLGYNFTTCSVMGRPIQSEFIPAVGKRPITHIQEFCRFRTDMICLFHRFLEQIPFQILIADPPIGEVLLEDKLH